MKKQLIHVGIPTLHCYKKLIRLLTALDNETHDEIEVCFSILDNGRNLSSSKWIESLSKIQSNITIIEPPSNLGVSASWNLFMRQLGQCIISNDDALFSKHDICMLLEAAKENPKTIFVGDQRSAWTVFWLNDPQTWLSMGGFDENFYPAYYEDDDAARRLKLANLPDIRIKLRDWYHDTSSTLHEGSAKYQESHWASFQKNGNYYCQKWGGMPGSEIFTTPFNTPCSPASDFHHD